MCFKDQGQKYDEYPVDYYIRFLDLIQSRFRDAYWPALPKKASSYCKPYMACSGDGEPKQRWGGQL